MEHPEQDKCIGLPSQCATQACDGEASARVHWPGNTCNMCGPCAVRAGNVAHCMGFSLTVEPLQPSEHSHD